MLEGLDGCQDHLHDTSMACELAPRGIRVNSLSPGYIYTKYTFFVAWLPQHRVLTAISTIQTHGSLLGAAATFAEDVVRTEPSWQARTAR